MPSVLSTHPTALSELHGELARELHALTAQGLRRTPFTLEALEGVRATINGRDVVCWCSNDYLGLSQHAAVRAAAAHAAQQWGVGARASRLLAGTTEVHERLEAALAAWYGVEDAVVFPSGYQANLGTLGVLAGPEDLVLIDRDAHASLVDAARATRATLRVFRHNDAEHVSHLLGRCGRARRRFVVTEGVFSMSGDRAPLAALVAVSESHGAFVYVDDAHGAFVLGQTGRGSAEAAGVSLTGHISMGTLGKALGAQGGFVVGPRSFTDLVRNRARTYVYSTAVAVPVAAAALRALRILEEEPQWRARLAARVTQLHVALQERAVPVPALASHILSVRLGDTRRALAVAHALWEQRVWAPAIRPPTVRSGCAQLRFSVTARHEETDIAVVADALARALAGRGVT